MLRMDGCVQSKRIEVGVTEGVVGIKSEHTGFGSSRDFSLPGTYAAQNMLPSQFFIS